MFSIDTFINWFGEFNLVFLFGSWIHFGRCLWILSWALWKRPLSNIDHLTLQVPYNRTEVFKNSYQYTCLPTMEQSTPILIRESETLTSFLSNLIKHYYQKFGNNLDMQYADWIKKNYCNLLIFRFNLLYFSVYIRFIIVVFILGLVLLYFTQSYSCDTVCSLYFMESYILSDYFEFKWTAHETQINWEPKINYQLTNWICGLKLSYNFE